MIHALILVIPAFAILFWLVFFFLDKKKTKISQYLIPLFFIALITVVVSWVFIDFNYNNYVCDSIWVFTSLSVYPLYYYYIRLLTVDDKIDYKWLWLLMPAFSLTVFSLVIYTMMSPQEIEIFTNEILHQSRARSGNFSTLVRLQIIRIEVFEIIFAAELILTLLFGLRHVILFEVKAFDFYSNIINRKSHNIRLPIIILLISAVTALVSNITGYKYFMNSPYILVIPFIIHFSSFIGILYYVKKQLETQSNTVNNMLQPTNNNPTDKDTLSDNLFNRMEHLLKNDHIYRDPTLRLNDLAMLLGSNRTYVSQLINQKTNSNFSEYINSYRIEYAKEILSSEEEEDIQLSLSEIAVKSGFSSLSSFYRMFTKLEETTPAKYREEHARIPVEIE